ncbi:erythromycin esterase family protein [Flavobacterium pedocola]
MKKTLLTICFFICKLTVSAQHIETKDILKDIGKKRIVAIGEDTHGTKEFQVLRHNLSKSLILKKGFNMIILENPSDNMLQLNKDLQKTANIDSLMRKHLFSIYQTKEMKDFLLWIKQYNATHKNKITLKGCDDSRLIAVEMLKESTKEFQTNTALQNMIQELSDCQTLSYSDYCSKYNKTEDKSQAGEMKFYAQTYDLITKIKTNIQTSKISNESINELLNELESGYLPYKKWSEGVFISRDELMANRVLYHTTDPKNKIIVLAHNAHISKKDIIDNEIGLMGKKIEEKMPNQYFSLGLMSADGQYSYIENRFINNDALYDDKLLKTEFLSLNQDSWNNFLANNESYSNKYLGKATLSVLPDAKRKIRLVGYGKEAKDKDYYEISKLSDIYDAVIILKNTLNSSNL